MVLLFLLAVLLAIPTSGLSLLAFLIFAVARPFFAAKSRMRRADEKRAERMFSQEFSPTTLSQQARLEGQEKVELFWDGVVEMAEGFGVPAVYSNTFILAPDAAQHFKEHIEKRTGNGATFFSKQSAGADFLQTSWNRMSDDQKAPVLRIAATGVRNLSAEELEEML